MAIDDEEEKKCLGKCLLKQFDIKVMGKLNTSLTLT